MLPEKKIEKIWMSFHAYLIDLILLHNRRLKFLLIFLSIGQGYQLYFQIKIIGPSDLEEGIFCIRNVWLLLEPLLI